MIHNSPKTIFFGTPDFSVIILKKLIESGMPPRAIVTAPDKPAGRGHHTQSPPIKLFVNRHHIPVLQPEKLKDEQFLQILRTYNTDVFVIAAYGKILPQILLDMPPKGTINVHPSLLPHHRGPSPIQQTILDGDKTAGVTVMLTDEKMDHGPILAQQEWEIAISQIIYVELHDTLAKRGSELLVETLPKWIAGEITPKEQDHTKATYTRLLTKEDGHINWTKSAEEIDRMVRALNPWPGTWSHISGSQTSGDMRRVKILQGRQTNEPSCTPPGTIEKTKNGLWAVCTGKNLYVIEKLQQEGKTPKDAPAAQSVINSFFF